IFTWSVFGQMGAVLNQITARLGLSFRLPPLSKAPLTTHAEWLVPLRVVGTRSGTSIELGRVRSAVHRGRVPTWRICWAHKSGHQCEAGAVGCMWAMTAVGVIPIRRTRARAECSSRRTRTHT